MPCPNAGPERRVDRTAACRMLRPSGMVVPTFGRRHPMTGERYGERLRDFNPTELERLRLLEGMSDPFSIHCLRQLGIQPGWRCLEVGAGAGSIAGWLADQAGAGSV